MTRRNGESIQAFTGQIAVDGDSGVIVGASLSNNPIDTPQFIPTLDAIEEATGQQPDKVSADSGYFSGENLAELDVRNIDGYIADDLTKTKRKNNPYSKDHFVYDQISMVARRVTTLRLWANTRCPINVSNGVITTPLPVKVAQSEISAPRAKPG